MTFPVPISYSRRFVVSVAAVVLLAVPVQVAIETQHVAAQSFAPPRLLGSDALGRAMPQPGEVRPFQDDKFVGIFYFAWLKNIRVYDNSVILSNHPDAMKSSASPPWGPHNAFHYWGEPLFGYYRSDDPWILRRHAALLSDAGVDFLVLDTTNGLIYSEVVAAMLSTFEQQRAAGEHVPQITFMVNSKAGQTADQIFETFYKSERYCDLWFRWQGKPLLICDPAEASEAVSQHFTLRKAHWPFELVNTHNAWHWEATYPQVYSYDQDPSQAEQVNVSVGQNLHRDTGKVEMMSTGNARGRSYHNGKPDPHENALLGGANFQEQWQHALKLDPQVTFVTGWNEWIAMQLNGDKDQPPVFCDQFNLEASRDVEMMKGGYGDNYYMQLAANIRRFKGMKSEPLPATPRTIQIAGPMDQWNDVAGTYHDHVNETIPRNFPGNGGRHYTVTSGRNDFQIAKVTEDAEHVYFYVQTREEISDPHGPNWMWLMLDLGSDTSPQWEGFELMVRGGSIDACRGGWKWESIGKADYRVEGNQMHLSVAKSLLSPLMKDQKEPPRIGLKWIDNSQAPGDIMDVYTHGDAAPGGRFRYVYTLQSEALPRNAK